MRESWNRIVCRALLEIQLSERTTPIEKGSTAFRRVRKWRRGRKDAR